MPKQNNYNNITNNTRIKAEILNCFHQSVFYIGPLLKNYRSKTFQFQPVPKNIIHRKRFEKNVNILPNNFSNLCIRTCQVKPSLNYFPSQGRNLRSLTSPFRRRIYITALEFTSQSRLYSYRSVSCIPPSKIHVPRSYIDFLKVIFFHNFAHYEIPDQVFTQKSDHIGTCF